MTQPRDKDSLSADRELIIQLYPDISINGIAEKLERSYQFVRDTLVEAGIIDINSYKSDDAIPYSVIREAIATSSIKEPTRISNNGHDVYVIIPIDQWNKMPQSLETDIITHLRDNGISATWHFSHFGIGDTRDVLRALKRLEKSGIVRRHDKSMPRNYVWELA